jgi:ribulose-phosphate 3-epimerase
MTVNPGYGGQGFIESSLAKIRRVRKMLDAVGSAAHIEVDGGITPDTAPRVIRAGANALVTGTAIFGSGDRDREAIRQAIGQIWAAV